MPDQSDQGPKCVVCGGGMFAITPELTVTLHEEVDGTDVHYDGVRGTTPLLRDFAFGFIIFPTLTHFEAR